MSEDINSDRKEGRWKSLLSTLRDADVEPMDVVLAEVAPGEVWDFAFWSIDPDGIGCSYRCAQGKTIWIPVETPAYTGRIKPWQDPHDPQRGTKPWQKKS